ncbi:hypothetical protein FZC78_16870 [Rossellomorea vietnamensis]|uniref:Uncharacterized protein n=1 Tax=Rossellomorea vietnamensis TaxID=218284 RepID=A0A5D4NM35_9BACI|nr:hypothetical protein [Rossellomorea vietnamensis]TYS14970.1 hypothetical protein FZC78_16870 [Rossellomorea vietnamensis]
MSRVNIDFLHENEVEIVSRDLKSAGVNRSKEYLELCIRDYKEGLRVVFVAKTDSNTAVGISHLLLTSRYPGFREENIPEINDLLVVPNQ